MVWLGYYKPFGYGKVKEFNVLSNFLAVDLVGVGLLGGCYVC